MLDKDKLLDISELDDRRINQLAANELDAFAVIANSFIDGFPTQEENVKNALENKDYPALTKTLSVIGSILKQLYATELAEACAGKLAELGEGQCDDIQAFVIEFLKTVSALSIDLQMAQHKEPGADDRPSEDEPDEAEASNTILAVDDRHFFLSAIKAMLQDTEYKVTCINSGAAALNYLANHRPGLFILDIEMPEMDGYELAGRIRESGQKAPIIFLTGNAKKEYVLKAIQAGAADFIIKPVNKDQLLERICRYLPQSDD